MSKNKNKDNTKEVFENWHKPIYEEDPDNAPTKFKKPPKRYETNFLAKLDKRTESYQLLYGAYTDVVNDMGGRDGLSHVQLCLAERFCFLEFILKRIELQIATEPKKSAKFVSRWVQGLNSLVGLAKTIGLEKRAKRVVNLKAYVEGKR